MMEWIVTSSAMILIVIALRGILKGKISLKLQYGLWALVLVRLLLPFSIVDSAISISNVLSAPVIQEADEAVADYENAYQDALHRYEANGSDYSDLDIRRQVQQQLYDRTYEQLRNEYIQTGAAVTELQIQTEAQHQVEVISLTAVITEALPHLWILGMIVVAVVLIGSNIHFGWKLRKSRTPLEIPGVSLKVYLTDYVATPCLFGLFKPDIYLTSEVMTDSQMRRHVLAHEMSHYRQGDHIWSVLRSLCLVLHWYNPLVWAAAILSKKDAELACDEATIKALGEAERTAYGRTLIGMTCVRRDPRSLMLTATTMLGTKKTLKERIALIAKTPKTALYTLIACILVVSLAVGCTFTGAPADPKTEEEKLLDRCREAVEYIQNLEHFEITEHTEITDNSDSEILGSSYEGARYIHSGDDWFHTLIGPDWTWQFISKDRSQYRRDITSAIPEEDVPYPNWTSGYFSNVHYANHCWIMDFEWTDSGFVLERNSVRTEYRILSVNEETDGDYERISLEAEIVDGPEDAGSIVFTFCFDTRSKEVVRVIRTNSDQTTTVTNTLSITPGTEEDMSAIIDGIYYDEIVTVVPGPQDTTSPTTEPTEPPTEPSIEPTKPTELNPEITKFQELLTYENGYWYWRAMGCVFEKPEDIDMSQLCYVGMENGQHSSTFTDNEIAFLKTQNIGIAGDESAWSNAHKLPREELNSVLQNHFGISLDVVTIPESWVYYSETDAYYDVRYDAYGLAGYTVTDVVLEDGLVYVYWTAPFGLRDTRKEDELKFLENAQMVMVLEERDDGGYMIHMNMPVEELLSPAEPAVDPTERDIIDILFLAEKLVADIQVGLEDGATYGVRDDLQQPLRDLLSRYDWTQVEDNDYERSFGTLFIRGYLDETNTQFVDNWFQLIAIEDGKFLLLWNTSLTPFEFYILTPKSPENASQTDIIDFVSEYFPAYDLPKLP